MTFVHCEPGHHWSGSQYFLAVLLGWRFSPSTVQGGDGVGESWVQDALNGCCRVTASIQALPPGSGVFARPFIGTVALRKGLLQFGRCLKPIAR